MSSRVPRRQPGAVALATVIALCLTAFALVVPGVLGGRSAGASGTAYQLNYWQDPNGNEHRVRWDPCRGITVAANLRHAASTLRGRAKAEKDLLVALHRVSRRTGMNLRYVGRTAEVPRDTATESWSVRQKSADLVVAWVDQRHAAARSNLLVRNSDGSWTSGTGGWSARAWTATNGSWRIAIGRGFVVINAGQRSSYQPGYGAGVTRGSLILHEIGHAMGLNHVGETGQTMYPQILNRATSQYHGGDADGLSKVGRSVGCLGLPDSVWPQISG